MAKRLGHKESEAHQAVQNALCPVKLPAPSLLVLNWYYLSVGLTITSWTDVSMAVISPIEGCAIGHPGTAAAWANRGHPRVSRKQYMEQKIFIALPNDKMSF